MTANQELLVKAADILVVDDSIPSLRMLTEILKGEGYKTRGVEDPQLALEAALKQPPDLILLDVRMPKMSGFELCRRLKQHERTREVPIIFVSALEEVQDRIQGFEVGGVDFVSKPIQEAEVLARVKTHLQLRYTQLHLEELVDERTTKLKKLLQERSEALRSAEDQIRLLFENSPMGIALSTFTGEFLTVNQALLDMLRISEEELMKHGVTDFYAEPADRETMLSDLQQSGSVQDFGIQVSRSDGEPFYASVNMNHLVLQGNEVLLTLVEDVTDQIMAKQEAAVLDERQRLAHELHDRVTQALFSASMIAETAPLMWKKDPQTALQYLEPLPVILRGALAEMRTLLLELRPDGLRDLSLGQLLNLLADSIRLQTRATVSVTVQGDRSLPGEVTMVLYRIVQESLNNVARHSEADQVNIWLMGSPEGVELHISDDGHGFDPGSVPPGHLGLSIMTERAQQIGATLEVTSEPGNGTLIFVSWSNAVLATE